MAIWYYRGPTYTGGPHVYEPSTCPNFDKYMLGGTSTFYKTVLKTTGVYTAHIWPDINTVAAADAVYRGGHLSVVDDAEKALIEASGVGGTFEAA